MDTNRIEQLRFQPIAGDLKRIDVLASTQDLFALIADFHACGISGLFREGFDPDEKNSAIYAFHLRQGGNTFAKVRDQYRAHVTKMLTLLGEAPDTAAADASVVLDLETALANASRTRVELRDPDKNYNKFTTAELLSKQSAIPWPQYFASSGLRTSSSESGRLVPVSYEIVGQPEFFTAVDKLLQTHPLPEWKTYLRWHLLLASAPYLHKEVEDEDFAFFGKVLSGQEEQEPRWKRSGKVIDRSIGEALGELYVAKYFPPGAKARMTELVDNLKTVFREHVEKLPWMTDSTRAKALDKFARFTQPSATYGAPKPSIPIASWCASARLSTRRSGT
jgi:predicted metalloendopeptidase